MNFLKFIAFAILIIQTVWAAESEKCPTPKEEQLNYVLLKDMIQNQDCQIKTISDLLSRLPESYRSGYSLYYKSQSIQGPHETDYLNPRALVFGSAKIDSTDSAKLVISFNGDPKQEGYNSIEILEVNDKGDKNPKIFNYSEIQFPYDEKGAASRSWGEARPTFSDVNPKRCIVCHGEPARPIFPAYPNWEGAYGSQHLGTIPEEEMKGMEGYVQKLQSPLALRYQLLGKLPPKKEVDHLILSNLTLNQKLGEANSIKLARTILETPDYEKYKYAFSAAFNGCKNLSEFIPEPLISDLFNNMEGQFNLKKNWPQKKMNELDKKIAADPRLFLIEPSFSGGYKTFVGNDQRFLRLTLDTISIQEAERADPMVPLLRLILEGRGLSMKNYFMDLIDQHYRSHNGGRAGDATNDELLRLDSKLALGSNQESVCIDLKKASLLSLKNARAPKVNPSDATPKNSEDNQLTMRPGCSEKIDEALPEIAKGTDIKKIITKNLEASTHKKKLLFERYCLQCHGEKDPVITLPLSSIEKMANYQPVLGASNPLQRLEQKIMPPSYAKLQPTDEERNEMIEVLKALTQK